MKFHIYQQKQALMILGTIAVISLMFTTWAITCVSTWIVLRDLDLKGPRIICFLAEGFFAGGKWFLVAEGAGGIFFLGLLRHTLYRSANN